jgi:uncharacterized membrane protein YGL010W
MRAMSSITEHLSKYATYHRDRRNIATHFFGIPLILFGVTTFLSRPAIELGPLSVSPAVIGVLVSAGFYLAVDLLYGAAMVALMVLSLWSGAALASSTTEIWLGAALAMFVGGWVLQLVGHGFEGKRPAFTDDLMGLIIGPLFLAAEVGFALGLRREIARAIVERAGPTVIRKRVQPS